MDLPDNVIEIDILRINRNNDKKCKCKNREFIVDTVNKSVHCSECGFRVEPYDALYELAMNFERVNGQVNILLKQRKEIASYKPHLIVFKRLESKYRGKKMLPVCPICGEAFYFENLTSWINKDFYERRKNK
ncbi:TPA: hypothetical protein KO445_002080 [Clostridioides difficile]|nr:hypothetical protein [Clostridioides difficile]HBF9956628.1 hypothetical protein [Clostridioides difficile]